MISDKGAKGIQQRYKGQHGQERWITEGLKETCTGCNCVYSIDSGDHFLCLFICHNLQNYTIVIHVVYCVAIVSQ